MFKKKRILFMLLASGLLVSCGGGSDASSSAPSSTSPTVSTPAAADTAAPAGTASAPATAANIPANGSDSPSSILSAGNPPSTGNSVSASTATAVDPQLNGYLEMVGDQIIYIRMNRVLYHPVAFPQFENDKGIVDVASGSPTPPPLDIDIVSTGCNPVKDGKCGIQPPAAAPVAPIAAFGIRISKFVHPSTPNQTTGNQTVIGRFAVDLTERTDSPGVGTNEVPEIMRFIIDGVKMSTDENGELVSVQMQDGAQVHVYGRSAAGVEIQDDIPAPAGTVRLLPMSQVPDNGGDTGSVVLLMDLETGFSQADQKLTALKNIAGHFSMNFTLSSIKKIVRPATGATADYPAAEQKNLVGRQIVVNSQPPVNGGGIIGNIWIRMYPPQ